GFPLRLLHRHPPSPRRPRRPPPRPHQACRFHGPLPPRPHLLLRRPLPLPPAAARLQPPPSFSLPLPASAIKTGLPVVRFSNHRKTRLHRCEPVCAVCLGALEARHEVRQLGNCSHAFHRACIDKWVDIGHVTCPLCRAQLLPSRREEEYGVDAD
ncbi:unnamed protein product, partial [Musa acuminata subsp. malaccensis]